MKHPFHATNVETYEFDDLPLGSEVRLVDNAMVKKFARALARGGNVYDLAASTQMVPEERYADAIVMSLYDTLHRYHRIRDLLPRAAYSIAVERRSHDIKPFVFVDGAWLENLHVKRRAIFALVDAVGVREAMRSGSLTPERLLRLRGRFDDLASKYPEVGFISFADNLLLKIDWQFGYVDQCVYNSYSPEAVLRILPEVREAFRCEGFEIYTIVTQGTNAYDEPDPLHVSPTKNHVGLNSLGLPFTQLTSIDAAVKCATRRNIHVKSDLYLETSVYLSLRLSYNYRRDAVKYPFKSPFHEGASYVVEALNEILANLNHSDL